MNFLIIFVMNILLFILLCAGIVHTCITNEVYLFAPFLLLYILSIIILIFSFAKYISGRKIKCNINHFFNFRGKIEVELFAKRDGDTFSLNYNNKEIKFETNTKIFKKGMFIAYIVRNIRFPEISNKHPLLSLFKKRLPITNLKNLVLDLDGKKYILVKNGISLNKYSFINKCWYYKDFLFKRSNCYIGKTICTINEKIFEEGRMDFTTKNSEK